MEVFVVLFWFWEGDNRLVNSYKGIFLTLDSAFDYASSLVAGKNKIKVYLPGKVIPEEISGNFYTDGFAQIVHEIL